MYGSDKLVSHTMWKCLKRRGDTSFLPPPSGREEEKRGEKRKREEKREESEGEKRVHLWRRYVLKIGM